LFAEPRLNHHTAVQAGVLAEPAAQLLRDFFADRREAQRAARGASEGPIELLPVPEVIESDFGTIG
jgi:tRNA(adenine34) deaminase